MILFILSYLANWVLIVGFIKQWKIVIIVKCSMALVLSTQQFEAKIKEFIMM